MQKVPPILKHIIEESKRPFTEQQIAAGAKAVYGTGSIKELTDANHAARQSPLFALISP